VTGTIEHLNYPGANIVVRTGVRRQRALNRLIVPLISAVIRSSEYSLARRVLKCALVQSLTENYRIRGGFGRPSIVEREVESSIGEHN
jgi:hypothetical protein